MKRRALLQLLMSGAATLPLLRVRLIAADDLTADHIVILREVAPTVLPSALGAKGADAAVDTFVAWLRGYKAGVPLAHGYGEPRLVRSGPSPSTSYGSQVTALQAAARARGGRFGALPIEVRRTLLDDAFKSAGIQNLPGRPEGKHVVADLMAHYFRSSAANDLCYNARIGRNTYRALQITTVRPRPLAG